MNLKKHIIITSLTSIFILFFISYIVIINSDLFLRKYKSIEEAMEKNNTFKMDEIIDVLESNGVYFVIFREDSTIKDKIVFSDMNGLYYCLRNDGRPKYSSKFNNHFIYIRERNNKVIIDISSSFSIEYTALIRDNVNSEFSHYEGVVLGEKINIWFLVLDELPKNYVITIDEKNIQIN